MLSRIVKPAGSPHPWRRSAVWRREGVPGVCCPTRMAAAERPDQRCWRACPGRTGSPLDAATAAFTAGAQARLLPPCRVSGQVCPKVPPGTWTPDPGLRARHCGGSRPPAASWIGEQAGARAAIAGPGDRAGRLPGACPRSPTRRRPGAGQGIGGGVTAGIDAHRCNWTR
jgi:hypothetical protein